MGPIMIIGMLAGHSLMGMTGMMGSHKKHARGIPRAIIDVRYPVCPLKGGKPKPEIAVLRRNRVYHFCSPECREIFQNEPREVERKMKNRQEAALRTTNPDGVDPVSGHPIQTRRKLLFLVRGDTITFYATPDTVGKDVNVASEAKRAVSEKSPRDGGKAVGETPSKKSSGAAECH